jgi:hypothetical protein
LPFNAKLIEIRNLGPDLDHRMAAMKFGSAAAVGRGVVNKNRGAAGLSQFTVRRNSSRA